ncbi:MAG: arginase [Clostridia bacterium]|nr:arginase [Deltaproteobacteria bacterium]
MPASKNKRIAIIGIPIDLGAGRRGVDMGPSAIRVAGLEARLEQLGHNVVDYGDVDVIIPETQDQGDTKLRYKKPIMDACSELATLVEKSLGEERVPLVLGGDHSITIGSAAGSAAFFAKRGEKLGLLWFDAHGDANTHETSPSGNIHGMSLAATIGEGDEELLGIRELNPKVDARHTVLIGVRDLDNGERATLKRTGVSVYTMRDIDERGMRDVVEEAVRIASDGTAGIHLSFDLDVVDPEDAPGTGTPVWGGITYREAHLAMEIVADRANIVSMDFVEVNPVLDNQNMTAVLATELMQSALGKTIF